MNGHSKESIFAQPTRTEINKNNNKKDDEFTCLEMLFCCWLCQDFNCWDDCGDLCDDDD
jgi:hypothetical protein